MFQFHFINYAKKKNNNNNKKKNVFLDRKLENCLLFYFMCPILHYKAQSTDLKTESLITRISGLVPELLCWRNAAVQ